MDNKLSIQIENVGEESQVKFLGVIDEDSSFEELKTIEANKININWEGIKGINSCGIREWTNCLKVLDSGKTIRYTNCPIHIVEQVNMIIDFVKKGTSVETFIAPYFCDDCDEEKNILLNVEEVKSGKAPGKKCDSCQSDLDFDAMEEQYFSFLN